MQAYADDMILAAKDLKTLEAASNLLSGNLKKLGLNIHPAKCELIAEQEALEITLDNINISSKTTARYLSQSINYKGLGNTIINKHSFTNLEGILSKYHYI